jgi:hypothetical protein
LRLDLDREPHNVVGSAMDNQNGITKQHAKAQSRAGVMAYLSYALDEVAVLSPTAAHLVEMAIAVLGDQPQAESEVSEVDRRTVC